MALNRIAGRAASTLPIVGIVLALANWHIKPAAARAWVVGIGLFLIMLAVRHGGQIGARRVSTKAAVHAALVRALAGVNSSIIFAALVMIVSLSTSLLRAYGLAVPPHVPDVGDPGIATRAVMIMCGVYLVAMGNGLPRSRPPVPSTARLGARAQAFHRCVGWTWVMCGLGWIAAWLALPIQTARPVSMASGVAALIVTSVELVRLIAGTRKPRKHAPA